MRRFPRLVSVAAAMTLALAAGGCGGGGGDDGKDADAAGGGEATTTTVEVRVEADNSEGNDTLHPGQDGTAGPQPATTAPTAPPGGPESKRLPLRAQLGAGCLHPGDTQTIEITSEPEAFVGYSSVYPDGKTGMDSGFYGGNDHGRTDANGTWKHAWVVAANAPPGKVTVDVVGAKGGWAIGQIQLSYELRGPLEPC